MELLSQTRQDLHEWMQLLGEPTYRADQVIDWIWQKNTTDTSKMSDLPAEIRRQLSSEFYFGPSVIKVDKAKDRSKKMLVRLLDGNVVEMLLMKSRSDGHATVCISTQVGCAFACTFCESGKKGLKRNLSTAEILAQVALCRPRPRNIVFMGIGEPLANWVAVSQAITRLEEEGGFSPRHMTLSTIGLPNLVVELAQQHPRVNLAISLHAPTDSLRQEIMPKAASMMNLKELMLDVKRHQRITGNRETFEYIMIGGVNDSVEHAQQLSELVFNIPSLINLIPFNPVSSTDYVPSSPPAIRHFLKTLRDLGHSVTVRRSQGGQKHGACGQLKARR